MSRKPERSVFCIPMSATEAKYTPAMNKYCPLVGVTLGGFQVFDRPTYIPLGKFTLLFGPNSSGKSAIQDAIEVVKTLESDTRLFSEPGGSLSVSKWNQIRQHLRVQDNGGDSSNNQSVIYIRSKSYLPIDLVVAKAVGKNSLVNSGQPTPIEVENRWLDIASGAAYELVIASATIVKAIADELTINLRHPTFWNVLTTAHFEAVAEANPDVVIFSDGKFTIKNVVGFNPLGIGFHNSPRNWLKLSGYGGNQQDKSETALNLLRSALSEISCLVGYLMIATNDAAGYSWSNVDASRRIPTPEELTFQLGSDWSEGIFGIHHSGDERYRNLAQSISSRIANQCDYSLSWGFSDEQPSKLADSVNNALMNHLFTEKIYQIGFDYVAYLPPDGSRNAMESRQVNVTELRLLVRLHLIDAQDRKLTFGNVGTGLGYVLPVLCAIFDESGDGHVVYPNEARLTPDLRSTLEHPGYKDGDISNSGLTVCFIQQPELHLHPALQAALGDVFIEASGGRNQLIIETHSEHLLLRFLKRVRQTHHQVDIAPELRLKPEDLCVIYFDPQTNGTTDVRRLRVTPEGDFMDRWPNGFFEERGKELFDE